MEPMSLISELREIIAEAVREEEIVSGVEIVGRFDWKWHAIPTLNEFRNAIKNVDDLKVFKDDRGLLQFSTRTELPDSVCEITKDDIHALYEAYANRMRKK